MGRTMQGEPPRQPLPAPLPGPLAALLWRDLDGAWVDAHTGAVGQHHEGRSTINQMYTAVACQSILIRCSLNTPVGRSNQAGWSVAATGIAVVGLVIGVCCGGGG